jgi:hypothetical protein
VSGSTGFTSSADVLTYTGATRRYDVKITGTYLAAQAVRWGQGIMKTGVYVNGSAQWVTSVVGNLYTITSISSFTLSSTDTVRVCLIQETGTPGALAVARDVTYSVVPQLNVA